EGARQILEPRSLNLACLPLAIDDRVVGAMTVVFPEERRLEDDERGFLQVIARQCAQALERWRLYSEIRDTAARAELLAESTAALARATTAGEVFEVCTDSARAIAAESAELWLADGQGVLQLAAEWAAHARTDASATPDQRLYEALRKRRVLYVESGVDGG